MKTSYRVIITRQMIVDAEDEEDAKRQAVESIKDMIDKGVGLEVIFNVDVWGLK